MDKNMNIETSYNFRKINDDITTSRVVRSDCLKMLASQGYEVVVNLMPVESKYAVKDEQMIVKSQKIESIYIPVDFKHLKRRSRSSVRFSVHFIVQLYGSRYNLVLSPFNPPDFSVGQGIR